MIVCDSSCVDETGSEGLTLTPVVGGDSFGDEEGFGGGVGPVS
jgi:hypothetical protein